MLAQRDWHQSLTNMGVRISYLSQGERLDGPRVGIAAS